MEKQDGRVFGRLLSYLELSGRRNRKRLVGVWTMGQVALAARGLALAGYTIEPTNSPLFKDKLAVVAIHQSSLVPAVQPDSSMSRRIQTSFGFSTQAAALAALAKANNIDSACVGRSAVAVYESLQPVNNLLPLRLGGRA